MNNFKQAVISNDWSGIVKSLLEEENPYQQA
jgi:hypothetical protein